MEHGNCRKRTIKKLIIIETSIYKPLKSLTIMAN